MTTRPAAAGNLGRDDLTERIFRALYQEFDLHNINGTYVAVLKGTPWFAGTSLGDIACQISDQDHPGPAASPAGPGQIVATTVAVHGRVGFVSRSADLRTKLVVELARVPVPSHGEDGVGGAGCADRALLPPGVAGYRAHRARP